LGRLAVAAAACLAVASSIAAPPWVSASPGPIRSRCADGYSYGGYASRGGVRGVAATLTALRTPTVATGHAAAWIGVGGVRQGPARADEWLQAGIAAFAKVGLRLYVEEVSRGERRRFTDLGPAVPGRSYRVRVVETGADVWQALVDGRAVGRPAYLPTRGGSWRAVATSESWAAGRASCTRYAYSFDRLSVWDGSRWGPLIDPERIGSAARLVGDASGFSAVTR
jgi:hypothetical protein